MYEATNYIMIIDSFFFICNLKSSDWSKYLQYEEYDEAAIVWFICSKGSGVGYYTGLYYYACGTRSI